MDQLQTYLLLAVPDPETQTAAGNAITAAAVELRLSFYNPAPSQDNPVVVFPESEKVPRSLLDVGGRAMRAAYGLLHAWRWIGTERYCIGVDTDRAVELGNAASAGLLLSMAFAAGIAERCPEPARRPDLPPMLAATGVISTGGGLAPVEHLPVKLAAAGRTLGERGMVCFAVPANVTDQSAVREQATRLVRQGVRVAGVQSLSDALVALGITPPPRRRRKVPALLALLVAAGLYAGLSLRQPGPAPEPATPPGIPLAPAELATAAAPAAPKPAAAAAPELAPAEPASLGPAPSAPVVPSEPAPGTPASPAASVPATAAGSRPPAPQILLGSQLLRDGALVGDMETLEIRPPDAALFVAAGSPAVYYRQEGARQGQALIVAARFGRPRLDAGAYLVAVVLTPPAELQAATQLRAADWQRLVAGLPPEDLLTIQVTKQPG